MKTNELKCTDLRIGNYVNIEGDFVKVKEIYEKSIHYANSEYESYATEDFIQPIELILKEWQPIYRALGRDAFIEHLKTNQDLKYAKQYVKQLKAKKK